MDRPPKADMDAAKVALFDYDDAPDLETLDRSCLEHWACCPFQAHAIESGRVKTVGLAAEAGEAIHQALATVTRTWVEDGDNMRLMMPDWGCQQQLRSDLEFELRRSRPDLQPEVLAGMMPSVWAWSRFLVDISPGNILAFDGGDDVGFSSQLAYDMPDLGARVTSELDLLYANRETVEVIEAVDYKTGHGTHDVYDVGSSFQFQMHAFLVLHHYPEVKALRLRVWNTRTNRITYAAHFPSSRFADYEWRVRSAVETRRQFLREAERCAAKIDPPTWPKLEACEICPAAAICPVADEPIADLATDPPGFVAKLLAVEARAEAMRKLAAAHVDATGKDIEAPDGTRFGRQKPRTERKATATLYTLNGETTSR